MNSFKDINIDSLDIPYINDLKEKKSIRFFNKHDNIQQILDSCIFCLDKEGL